MAWTDKGPRAADSSKTAMRQEILLRLTGPVSTPEMGFLSVLLTSSKGGREGGYEVQFVLEKKFKTKK